MQRKISGRVQKIRPLPTGLRSTCLIWGRSLHGRSMVSCMVSIATHYRLDCPGIHPSWRETFRTRPYWPWNPLAACKMGSGSLSRGLSDRGMMLTTHPNLGSEVKERVELYSPSWPSWPALELIFYHVWAHFLFFLKNWVRIQISYSMKPIPTGK